MAAVDFWCINYFRDKQYLKVSNKPVLEIFQPKDALPYLDDMREEAKKFGYAGLIVISNDTVSDKFDYTSWYNITNVRRKKGY